MKKKHSNILIAQTKKYPIRDLNKYRKIFTSYFKNRPGLYILYKGNTLYYIGRASSLHNRTKTHLENKHKKKWNKFKFFIAKSNKHNEDIESCLISIIKPKGNKKQGREFKHSKTLQDSLKERMDAEDKRRDVFGRKNKPTKRRKRRYSKKLKTRNKKFKRNKKEKNKM